MVDKLATVTRLHHELEIHRLKKVTIGVGIIAVIEFVGLIALMIGVL